MREVHRRRELHRTHDVPGRVFAADGFEHARLERLRVDADAVRTVVEQHLQLLTVDRVGPPGLHAVLRAVGEVKAAVQVRQQTVHLLG